MKFIVTFYSKIWSLLQPILHITGIHNLHSPCSILTDDYGEKGKILISSLISFIQKLYFLDANKGQEQSLPRLTAWRKENLILLPFIQIGSILLLLTAISNLG